MTDFKSLADQLVVAYSALVLDLASKTIRGPRIPPGISRSDQQFLYSIIGLSNSTSRYNNGADLDKALDTIDLAKIYAGVDKRESENKDPQLGYEDFLVLELLHYFKHDFFKWVTVPECPGCKSSSSVQQAGVKEPPTNNPQEITRIEVYTCKNCKRTIEFPRINNPVSLLETRIGRCGEWVNCFLLVLKALLGSEAKIRYVWNAEDHVWCEYYSLKLQRWIHLDPCEGVFDEPSLYAQNWGKKMSWCIGINDEYVIDLSEKYITVPDKKINKTSRISNTGLVRQTILRINAEKLYRYYLELVEPDNKKKLLRLYNEVIVPRNREIVAINALVEGPKDSKLTTKGRQTGGGEWTKTRGEDGA